MSQRTSRRAFVKSVAIASTATALPAFSYARIMGANERLRVASVGTGGKGWSDLNGVAASPHVQVVALCDIDSSHRHLGQAAEKFPQARQYADWRKLLDESQDVDGVIVSTPDFMHAPVGLAAMHLRKHVFCQKPLTHTIAEARQMQLAAHKFNVVTQMGNQIQSHEAYRTAVNMVHSGLIGKVKEVHSWQGGSPRWPRHIDRPEGADPIPAHVSWDLWQGVAERRPYKAEIYHPFAWRGWQAYGTGQLGDFGCHILDPVFKSLALSAPRNAQADAPLLKAETWTDRVTVKYVFPGTAYTADKQLTVTWYDAVGVIPPRKKLKDIPANYKLPNAGSVLIGELGSLVIPHVALPKLFPEEKFPELETLKVAGVDHYVQWADACRGQGQTTSSFDYSGPLTEAVLLGTIALRYPTQKLLWDSKALSVKNLPEAQKWVSKPYRKGWELPWIT
jgi:predicted dehydrogenase